jgi:hypothetical protein
MTADSNQLYAWYQYVEQGYIDPIIEEDIKKLRHEEIHDDQP